MRALFFLLWRDTMGQGRRLWRQLRSWRGAAKAAFFALLIAGLTILVLTTLPSARASNPASEGFRSFAPFGLLALLLLGLLAPRGLYFRPAEVAWLFPAPLRRRDLVLFNVLSRARVAVFSALWLAAFPTLRGGNMATTLVGYFLCLLLLQITAQWFALLRVWWAGANAPGRQRAAGALAAAFGFGAAAYAAYSNAT